MKKMLAMLLALCMLCSVWTMAGAEGEIQTVGMQFYEYELPAAWSLEANDEWQDGPITYYRTAWSSNEMRNFWATGTSGEDFGEWPYNLYYAEIDLRHWEGENWIDWSSGYSNLKEAAEDEGLLSEGQYSVRKMTDGSQVACAKSYDRWTCLWIKGSLWAKIRVEFSAHGFINGKSFEEEIYEDVYNNVILPIFASIRPAGEEPEQTRPNPNESAGGKQAFHVGNATFQVDDNLVIEAQDPNNLIVENDRYGLMISCFNWAEMGIDLGTPNEIPTVNTAMLLYFLTGDRDAALIVSMSAVEADCNMPNGGIVQMLKESESVILTHYDRGTGFMVHVLPIEESIEWSEMFEVAVAVTQSFQLDEAPAAEMNAAEEEAPADLPEEEPEEAPEEAPAEEAPAAAEQAPTQRVYIKSKGGANIRSGPDASASKMTYGYKGDSFPLLGEEGTWYKIDVNG